MSLNHRDFMTTRLYIYIIKLAKILLIPEMFLVLCKHRACETLPDMQNNRVDANLKATESHLHSIHT